MSIWEADEHTDGWMLLKEENGVVVHKKAAVGMYIVIAQPLAMPSFHFANLALASLAFLSPLCRR